MKPHLVEVDPHVPHAVRLEHGAQQPALAQPRRPLQHQRRAPAQTQRRAAAAAAKRRGAAAGRGGGVSGGVGLGCEVRREAGELARAAGPGGVERRGGVAPRLGREPVAVVRGRRSVRARSPGGGSSSSSGSSSDRVGSSTGGGALPRRGRRGLGKLGLARRHPGLKLVTQPPVRGLVRVGFARSRPVGPDGVRACACGKKGGERW
jgi:hypothetical protein